MSDKDKRNIFALDQSGVCSILLKNYQELKSKEADYYYELEELSKQDRTRPDLEAKLQYFKSKKFLTQMAKAKIRQEMIVR